VRHRRRLAEEADLPLADALQIEASNASRSQSWRPLIATSCGTPQATKVVRLKVPISTG
jgi:hypothetical protein